MSKTTSDDPNKVTDEVVAANGQAVDIAQYKAYDGSILNRLDKTGGLWPARIHKLRCVSEYGFSSLKAAVDATPTSGEALAVFIASGIWEDSSSIVLPKNRTTSIVGTGAPSQEPDMSNDCGSIINSKVADGFLSVTQPTHPETAQVLLKDLEFRQHVQQTSKYTAFVNMTNAWIGGIERCTFMHIAAKTGLSNPLNGTALDLNIGSAGDRFWVRDVNIGGFGGPENDPAPSGIVSLGGNHLVIDNLHINGCNKKVGMPLRIAIVGHRWQLSNISFFQIGTYGQDTNAISLIVWEAQPSAMAQVVVPIHGLGIESIYPSSWQTKQFFWGMDNKVRLEVYRAYNTNFNEWNPFRSSQSKCLVLHNEVSGPSTVKLPPVGFVTNFVDTTNSLLSPMPIGTAGGLLASAVTYTVEVRPMTLYLWGGTISEILINGVNIPQLYNYYLEPGDTIKVTWSVQPSSAGFFHR